MRPAMTTPLADPAFSRPGEIAQRLLSLMALGRRCQKALLAAIEHLGLTDTQLLVLWSIQQANLGDPSGVMQSEIAQSVGISPGQISGLVEQLRRSGHLNSTRGSQDRRQQLWSLTPSGQSQLEQALSAVAGVDGKFLEVPEASVAVAWAKLASAAELPSPETPRLSEHEEAA